MSGILIVTEQQNGAWNRMSMETLAAGQQLAGELGQTASAVVVGQGIDTLANELATKMFCGLASNRRSTPKASSKFANSMWSRR